MGVQALHLHFDQILSIKRWYRPVHLGVPWVRPWIRRPIKRAEAKLTSANLAYNMDRLIFHERRAAMG